MSRRQRIGWWIVAAADVITGVLYRAADLVAGCDLFAAHLTRDLRRPPADYERKAW